MRLRTPIALLLCASVACCTRSKPEVPTGPGPVDSCNVEAKGEVRLTSAAWSDVVQATVRGPSCHDSTFRAEIRAQDGQVIYRYSQPLQALLCFAPADTPADMETAARRIVDRAAAGGVGQRTSSLPEYHDGTFVFEYEGVSRTGKVLVSKDVYVRLRKGDQPMFHHPTGCEMGRYVAFDPATNRVTPVLDSWM